MASSKKLELPEIMSGREFTIREIREIQETVRDFRHLSWSELVFTVCEHLEWVTEAGHYKYNSCRNALDKMEALGLIQLPERRTGRGGQGRTLPIAPSAATAPEDEIGCSLQDLAPIEVLPVYERGERRLWDEYVDRYHPLRYKRPFGAHQRYFVVGREGRKLGCLMFAASAWALAERDAWIGWTRDDRSQRLKLVVGNTRMLLFPWVRVKCLASKALSLAASRIREDWQQRYGYRPVLLETFVEVERYRGTCYRAANWIYVGQTQGRGRMDRHTQYLSTVRAIYVYPLEREFRQILRGEIGQKGGNHER